jgi:hypothetical protein
MKNADPQGSGQKMFSVTALPPNCTQSTYAITVQMMGLLAAIPSTGV